MFIGVLLDYPEKIVTVEGDDWYTEENTVHIQKRISDSENGLRSVLTLRNFAVVIAHETRSGAEDALRKFQPSREPAIAAKPSLPASDQVVSL